MKLGLKRILAGGVTVLLVSLACSINVDLGQSSHTNLPTDTVVARTLEALTQPAVGTTTSLATEVTFTSTAVVGTSTPVSTSTPQPTTVTSEALCYAGPGDAYEVVSSIKPGTQVKLLGRGALSGWLVLANPIYTDPCWIMSQYVSMDPSIDTSTLIVYAVPPTPTPDLGFQLQYQFLNICSGWDPVFSVRNTGGKTFRSYDAVVVDSNATTQYERKANDFGKPSGCSLSSSIPQLGANQSGWVHAFGFGYSIVNKKLEVTVTLCTGTAQNGDCTTQSLPFSPP